MKLAGNTIIYHSQNSRHVGIYAIYTVRERKMWG